MTLNFAVDTSRFDPFKYHSAAVLTLKDYSTAYQRLEELMDKIAEEKGLYILPDTPDNQEYRDIMDKYNTEYNAVAEDFSRGMNLENARKIRDLRKRYFNEVTPINRAIDAYNKDQDKMITLGADAIIGNKNRTIKDYYGGLNPGIDYRSARSIQQTSAGIMQGIDNALMEAPEQAGKVAKLYFILKQQGFDGNEALKEILKYNPLLNSQLGVSNTNQLIQALDRVYLQYAFDEGTPENSKIWENVVTGAIQGIQAPKYTMQIDHGYLNSAQQYALKQQLKEDKFKYKYDEQTGAITGWNDDYLKGARSSKSNSDSDSEYEELPDKGTFHSVESGKKEEDVVTSTEVSRKSVPSHITAEYPNNSKFYACKDDNGKIIGYKGIRYKKVKKASTSEVDEAEGEEE